MYAIELPKISGAPEKSVGLETAVFSGASENSGRA